MTTFQQQHQQQQQQQNRTSYRGSVFLLSEEDGRSEKVEKYKKRLLFVAFGKVFDILLQKETNCSYFGHLVHKSTSKKLDHFTHEETNVHDCEMVKLFDKMMKLMQGGKETFDQCLLESLWRSGKISLHLDTFFMPDT